MLPEPSETPIHMYLCRHPPQWKSLCPLPFFPLGQWEISLHVHTHTLFLPFSYYSHWDSVFFLLLSLFILSAVFYSLKKGKPKMILLAKLRASPKQYNMYVKTAEIQLLLLKQLMLTAALCICTCRCFCCSCIARFPEITRPFPLI